MNDVLDKIHKSLRQAQPKEEGFKKLKWVLFKRAEHLSEQQSQVLEQAFEKAPELKEAYQLRNSFHYIFDYAQDKVQASRWLERWIKEVEGSRNSVWDKFLNTLANWKDLILNFVDTGLSNALTEGLNNLVRYMRRLSFGLPNFEHMRLRILVSSA